MHQLTTIRDAFLLAVDDTARYARVGWSLRPVHIPDEVPMGADFRPRLGDCVCQCVCQTPDRKNLRRPLCVKCLGFGGEPHFRQFEPARRMVATG